MEENYYHKIEAFLTSSNPEEIRKGLALVKDELSRIDSNKAKTLCEVVSALFYIDPLDRPDLVPLLDEAVTIVADFGKWIIPYLVKNLDAGDLKAEMAIAHALGRMGEDAILPLINEYYSTSDSAHQTFILYALSKIKSPKIVQAVPLALEAIQSSNLELCDTATRTIGKFVESIPPSSLLEELRCGTINKLQINLKDQNPGVRAKAARSLGKLAKYGHLNDEEKESLKKILESILGINGNYEWDRAYVVRKEAKEALNYL